MKHDLEQFSAACHAILKQDPGVEGRKRVCALVQDVLKDDEFIKTYLTDDVPERQVLYEDPELGFCILGHVYHGAKDSNPHDHGPSWAIYGQARGETVMTDYALVKRASEGQAGKARRVKDYTLTPGMAYLYNEGDLHSPRRDGPTVWSVSRVGIWRRSAATRTSASRNGPGTQEAIIRQAAARGHLPRAFRHRPAHRQS